MAEFKYLGALILKDNMHILRSKIRKLGLAVNIKKTKSMVTRRDASCNANRQLMTNENFEEVAEFKYNNKIIAHNVHRENCSPEIIVRDRCTNLLGTAFVHNLVCGTYHSVSYTVYRCILQLTYVMLSSCTLDEEIHAPSSVSIRDAARSLDLSTQGLPWLLWSKNPTKSLHACL